MKISKLLLTTLLILSTTFLTAQIIYVEPFGSGEGASWANATSLQSALETVSFGTEIWVKSGIYTPVNCNSCTQEDRDISFDIPSGILLYGGFSGTETAADQRNPWINVTILSGDIDNDDTDDGNSNTVVFTSNSSTQTIIDGFTISNGNADFADSGSVTRGRRGGGWYNDGSGSGNSSSPTIRRCIFENNYANSQGGGLFNDATYEGYTAPLIEDCIFRNNISNLGGGICNNTHEGNSSPKIKRCQFIKNQAFATGGAVYNFARESDSFANATFTNCLFRENFASSCGAVYSLGAANGNVITEITNCTFYKNHANVGGAVYVNASDGGDCETNVANCIFWENYAGFDDIFHYSGSSHPIIHLSNSLVDISNCDDLLQGSGSIDCQSGIIYNQDPIFVDAAALDFRLAEESPCVNVGSNSSINATGESTDLAGFIRIQNGTVDLGCFEFGGAGNLPLIITEQTQNQTSCAGESATFTISVTGTQPITYQWQKNNISISGETSNTLVINETSDSDVANYHCIITDANGESLTGQDASLTINPTFIPAVNITADNLNICEGESITFTATPTNGSSTGSPFYIWQVNGNNVEGQNEGIFISENAMEGDAIGVTMISSEECASPSSAQSQILLVTTIAPPPHPTIIIVANINEICPEETVTFTSNITNSGDSPTYIWRLNGIQVATTPNYTTDLLLPDNNVTCEVSIVDNCGETLSTTSEAISVNIQTFDAPQVSIESSETQICQGEPVIFTPVVSNPGVNQTYIWRLNGEIAANTEIYTTNQLTPDNNVICQVTVTDACGSSTLTTSNSQSVSVQVPTTPLITIQTANTTQCAGENLSFSALVENAGDSPIYDWRINDISVAVGNEFTTNTLVDNDIVTCILTTSQTCVTSNTMTSNEVIVTILPIANPEIIITASDTEICQSESVTFNASLTDGGESPNINWLVNGALFATNETSFTLENIDAFTTVQVQMETSVPCSSNPFAFSEVIEINITEYISPTVAISVDTTEFCTSDNVTAIFTANTSFPAVSYTWFLNGSEVENSSLNTLELTIFSTGDIVSCQTTSEGNCLVSTEANSEEITLTVYPLPEVSLLPFDTICSNENLLTLVTGSPLGGEYLGDFVDANTFNPMLAGIGFHTIAYSFTDENNCSNMAEEEIEVVLCTRTEDLQTVDLEVFPNPFSNQVQVFAEDILQVEMYNEEGKALQIEAQIDGNSAVIFADNLVSGLYFLKVLTKNGVAVSILLNE